jgi:hypothetical protein
MHAAQLMGETEGQVSQRRLLLYAALAITFGCTASVHPIVRSAPPSLCFIGAAEVRRTMATSLYEALRELRPSLLRLNMHGELPIVILDGAVTSDASAVLHSLSPDQVASVRRLSASEATQRYGLHRSNAVLEVLSLSSPNAAASKDRGVCA